MCLWVYTDIISIWGVWYFIRKSTPKNECLQLKTLDFWRLWKWRNLCDPEDFVFMRQTWSVKTFIFVGSCSLTWVIGNTVLLKGVEEKLRKSFQVMLISKSYTYQSFRVKPLENLIQFSQFLQWQRRRPSGLWGICSDWGVRNLPVRITYKWGTW